MTNRCLFNPYRMTLKVCLNKANKNKKYLKNNHKKLKNIKEMLPSYKKKISLFKMTLEIYKNKGGLLRAVLQPIVRIQGMLPREAILQVGEKIHLGTVSRDLLT